MAIRKMLICDGCNREIIQNSESVYMETGKLISTDTYDRLVFNKPKRVVITHLRPACLRRAAFKDEA